VVASSEGENERITGRRVVTGSSGGSDGDRLSVEIESRTELRIRNRRRRELTREA